MWPALAMLSEKLTPNALSLFDGLVTPALGESCWNGATAIGADSP